MQTAIFPFVLAVLFFAAVNQLLAGTIVVTDLGDAGPGTLRQAMLDANATAGDDTISFATNGTITLVTELPAITDNTAIIGPGVDLLKISGNSLVRVFYMNAGTTNTLSDLTVADGFAAGIYVSPAPAIWTNASGIANAGVLTIQRCVVTNCLVTRSLGAGVYNSGDLDMEQVLVADCWRTPTNDTSNPTIGAGLYNKGTVRMADCVITNCHGFRSGSVGSGIYNASNSKLFAMNTRIEFCKGRHSQSDGGGIATLGETVLQSCQIRKCGGSWGGGITSYSGSLIMTNTIVEDCNADYGGGILIFGGTGLFEGCTISSNRSWDSGGGVLNGGSLLMYNCTLSGNYRTDPRYSGSAFSDNFPYYGVPFGTTFLSCCTVVSNSGLREIRIFGTFNVSNSILGSLEGTIVSGGNNLIVNTTNCVITGTEAGNIYDANPLLGPLQDNGGFTFTHALLPGSPAIDHADASDPLTDQRGVARPVGPLARDIGAFEVVPASPPTLAISFSAPSNVVISWPSPPAAFVLQQNSGFDSNAWMDVGGLVNNDGITRWTVLPANGDHQFYRLRSP